MFLFKKNYNAIMRDIGLGFKKAYSISLLPARVEVFYSSLAMRIFRVVGGASIALVLTGKYILFYKELQILILIFSLMHSILITCIFVIKFFYGLYVIIKKPHVFEVRNSPINHFSTHIARIIICAKWGCGTVAGTTGVLAGAVTYDTILEATGREKIFVLFVARVFNDVFGEPMEPQNYQNLKPVLPSEDVDVEALQKSYDNLSPKEKEALYNLIVKERKES